MRKNLLLLLAAAIVLLAIPSCQKCPGKWTKHTLTEEYEFVNDTNGGQEKEKKEKKEKQPSIFKWTAKRMAKAKLEELEIINKPITVPVTLGYYECNSVQDRENLYKLQVNGLLNVNFSEIKNKYDRPTFWVDVRLTDKGKALIVKSKAPVFPEDTINPDYMNALVNPETGLNQYGEYTVDPNVDDAVVSLIKNFYLEYRRDKAGAIARYGTADLQQADQRIRIAEGLEIHRLLNDPFLREGTPSIEAIDTLGIWKWNSYVDLYIVRIDDAEYCFVVKEEHGQKKIDDIALNSPTKLAVKRTMRCTAAGISARELHKALKVMEAKAKTARANTNKQKNIVKAVQKYVAPEILEFEEYNPRLEPGIMAVVHTEPTLYQIAKEAEHKKTVNLMAGIYKFKEMGKLRKNKLEVNPRYTAKITVKCTKVNALGRIFCKLVDGSTETLKANFNYDPDEEEWTVGFTR